MSPNEFEHDPWTPERRKLQQWFQENAPRLEDPYVAAVRLLSDRDFPARPHLIGHLVREIANGLPEAVTGRRVRRFDTTKALDELAAEWPDGIARAPSFSVAASTPPPEVAVPAPLVNRVSGLVRDHTAVKETARDQTAALIDALRPGSRDLRVVLEPVLREWARVVAWFVSQTHLPRGAKAQDVDGLELERQFHRFQIPGKAIGDGAALHAVNVDQIVLFGVQRLDETV